jgi:3-hydroxyacyl-[acyl-carrier-protein] dehydratase
LLLNDLYTIQSLKETDHQIQASVRLRADHPIFNGHFPGQPVLPGVCMLEMIAEITGENAGEVFRISGAPLIKFLRMIDPGKNPQINLEIKCNQTPEGVTVNGKIFYDTLVFMKFQMNLVRFGRI